MATKFSGQQSFDVVKFEKEGNLREIGGQAVWSLSSCKSGYGVEQLRDGNIGTFWQSDDATPHYINIQFKRKMPIASICLYMDYKNDESYTPHKISIKVGSHFHDLSEVELIEMNEPNGWVHIPLKDRNECMVKAFMIQIVIISNHQNGKDTHLRQVKVHSPIRVKDTLGPNTASAFHFNSLEMTAHSIR